MSSPSLKTSEANVGLRLFNVAATTVMDPCHDRLPRRLEVLVKDLSADTPTHLFAVHSKPITRVTLYPVHALVFAAHCAHLPPIPHTNSAAPTEDGKKIVLPVVPFCLPNPPTFLMLLDYLYTKRGNYLLAALLPILPRGPKPSLTQLSQTLAASYPVHALLSFAAKVHGLWSNVVVLGVFDKKLSQIIEVAWKVLLDALAISPGASWTEGTPSH
jgi:hypothetical protein